MKLRKTVSIEVDISVEEAIATLRALNKEQLEKTLDANFGYKSSLNCFLVGKGGQLPINTLCVRYNGYVITELQNNKYVADIYLRDKNPVFTVSVSREYIDSELLDKLDALAKQQVERGIKLRAERAAKREKDKVEKARRVLVAAGELRE